MKRLISYSQRVEKPKEEVHNLIIKSNIVPGKRNEYIGPEPNYARSKVQGSLILSLLYLPHVCCTKHGSKRVGVETRLETSVSLHLKALRVQTPLNSLWTCRDYLLA